MDAFVLGAVRTPVGKRNGSLAKTHPADMGAHVISALVTRTGIDPAVVDDVPLEDSGLVGRAVVERVLGGRLLEERPNDA